MTREELAQDLAYARTLAEEGRHAPLLGGSFMVFWGALNFAAYLGMWLLLSERIPDFSGVAFIVLWVGYGIVAGVGSGMVGRRVRDKPGVSSFAVRAERAVWLGVAMAIGVTVIGAIGHMFISQDTGSPNVIMCAAFALFGVAMHVTAALSQQKWLTSFATLSFAVAAATYLFVNEPWAYLLAAIACAVVLIIPGLRLMRQEPSTTV